MKNSVLAIFAAATVLLAALAWWQHQQIGALQQAAVSSTAEQGTLKRKLAEGDQRLAAAEKARADAELELKELRNRPPAAPAAAQAGGDAARAAMAMSALDNPATQKFLAATFKSTLDQRFGGLFRQLKLSPAELDKFKDLLAERQMSTFDVMRAIQTQGLNLGRDPAALSKLVNEAQASVDESVHTLLGDERFAQYQDFNQNIASYGMLDQIERRLSYTNAPLSAEQSDALLRVLVQTSRPPDGARGAMANFAQSMAGMSPLTASLTQRPLSDETIAAAQAVLSPAQVDGLRQVQAEQRSQANVFQSMRGTNPAGGGTVPPQPSVPPPPR